MVSSGSIHDVGVSNLGKKAFSRGRSEIRGWKLGQKGPLGDSRLHGSTVSLPEWTPPDAALRLDLWTMFYTSALFVL